MAIFALLAVAACILSSCGNIKGASSAFDFAPPKPEDLWIPHKSIRREPFSFSTDELASIEDREVSLAEAIDIALTNNPSTEESWAMARASAAEYGQSLQKYYVLSKIDADFFTRRYAAFATDDRTIIHENSHGASLDLTYTILDFGQTRSTSQAALNALYQSDLDHNREIQTVVVKVMNSYYEYLSQKSQLEAAKQDVINAEVSLDAVLEKLRNGVADISDKVQATTNLLQRKLYVVSQEQLLTTAYTDLLNELGLPSNSVLTFAPYPEEIQLYHIATLDELLQKAIAHRPDLLAKETMVHSYENKLAAAKAQRYPIVTGDFNIGRRYYNQGVNDHYDYKAQVNLTLPLFQGFFIENGIKLAKANLESAKAELRLQQLELTKEVTNYHSDVSYARESYRYAKEFLDSALEDFRLNLERYKVGTSTIIDLITAQTSVADARSQLVQSEKKWYTSLANIAYATGVLSNYPQTDQEIESDLQNTCSINPLDDRT